MSILYQQWYKAYGIRVAGQLMTPPLIKLDLLNLPKQSILHYVTTSPLDNGPAVDDFIFRNIARPIMVGHIVENGDTKGNPRHLAVSSDAMIRTYHIKHRRFKIMRTLEASTRDPNTLVVYNYGLLPSLYRYMRSYYTEYYKFCNIQAAVWKNIAKIAVESERNQFLICKLPLVLPSIPDLRLANGPISQKIIKIFNTPESLTILELWKWFGIERGESMISNIPIEQLDKVNLIFQESGVWFAMNLGRMNRWRIATKDELEANPDLNTKGIDAKQLQRRFLRLMMALTHARTVATNEVPTDKIVEGDNVVVKQDIIIPDNKTTGTIVNVKTTNVELPEEVLHDEKIDETITHDDDMEKQLDADLTELENISKAHVGPIDDEGNRVEPEPVINEVATLEDGILRTCNILADNGLLSAAEYRRYIELSKTYKTILAPNGKETLDKFIVIKPELLSIDSTHVSPDIATVLDKTMLKSSLIDFDQKYIKEVLHRDVAGMVMSVQNAGIAVTSYESERIENVMGSFDSYTIKVKPVDGLASTLRFELPVLDDDGIYQANGSKYRMRKQKGDFPIHKISPMAVALTSYYGKTFVTRNSKHTNDYGQWLRNIIMAKGIANDDTNVTSMYPTNVFDNLIIVPKLYSTIAMGFRGFTVKSASDSKVFVLSFDYAKREEFFGLEALKSYEKDGAVIVGRLSGNNDAYLVMGKDSELYIGQNNTLVDYSTIEELLGIDSEKAPVEFAELRVMGKTIPIGIILGYELGLSRLMKLLNVNPRRVHAGTRVNLEPHEISIVFSDETLVFSNDDKKASIILAGFNEYHKVLRGFSVYEFDKRAVYLNVLESNGIGARYLRELDLLYQMFIDPITRDLLLEMKEPTTFHGLLIRSCELLLTDQHPDELDPAFMRIKGYERLAGAVYSEVVKSIRAHNGRIGKSKQPIDLNPYAVWMNIRTDPSVALVSDINPIQNLKEVEAVTFAGTGGRGSRSMTKHTRIYHKNDMGTMSESTVDSSDVAINTFTSADPQFTSLRGISKRYEIGKTGATALFSTTALMSPCSDMDDPKRVNFASIQASHVVSCNGYGQAAVRTGYEQVIAHRTSDLFALTAKKDGKVTDVTDSGIIVEYADGETKGYEIGRRFGNAAGLVIPHSVVSNVKVGQKFKEGDLLSYNDGFFEKDMLNPNSVVWKSGVTVKTALMESNATLEDSSAISSKIANLLTTKTTKVKDIVITFDQSVHKLVKEGTNVETEDILCIIEDAITANAELFDTESLDTLRILSSQTPQAKTKGVIERIEVYYHGDKEDMSESLRTLVTSSDQRLGKRNKTMGKKAFTGAVDKDFRVDGDPLALDTANIRIYITGDVAAGIGDKAVFCNQMKTIFGEIFNQKVVSEGGTEIDAIFGYESINARIVNSPLLIGTTTTLLDIIGHKAVALYFDK
jgi:hypothetical protein